MRDGSGQMYRRNRYYDPATGQFTQQDPIGIAGGLNTYGFAAGDPVSYSDPYGLYVCAQTRAMRRGIERTYNMNITWGADNCVRDPNHTTSRGSPTQTPLQEQFDAAVTSHIRFDVSLVDIGGRRSQIIRHSAGHYELRISRFQYEDSWLWDTFDSDRRRYGMIFGGECRMHTARFTLQSLIVHEFGHAYEVAQGRSYKAERPAVNWENLYHQSASEAIRCGLPEESFR